MYIHTCTHTHTWCAHMAPPATRDKSGDAKHAVRVPAHLVSQEDALRWRSGARSSACGMMLEFVGTLRRAVRGTPHKTQRTSFGEGLFLPTRSGAVYNKHHACAHSVTRVHTSTYWAASTALGEGIKRPRTWPYEGPNGMEGCSDDRILCASAIVGMGRGVYGGGERPLGS